MDRGGIGVRTVEVPRRDLRGKVFANPQSGRGGEACTTGRRRGA